MPDNAAGNKDIIAIKVKVRIPQQYSSGLIVIYADPSRANLLSTFSIVVLGQDLAGKSLSMKHDQLVDLIRAGAHKFEMNNDLQNKLRHSLEFQITQDVLKSLFSFVEANDPGSSENLLKRTLERMLSMSKIEVQMEHEYMGKSEFAHIKAEEEVEKATYSQKLQTVLPYANNARDVAEKIIRENIKDVAIIKVCLHRENEFYACGVLVISVQNSTLHRAVITAGADPVFNEPNVSDSLVDFFDDLAELVTDERADATLGSRIEAAIRKVDVSRLSESILEENQSAVNDLIFSSLRDPLGEGIEGGAAAELMNSLKMEFLLKPARLRKTEDKSQAKSEEEFKGLKVIGVDLLLSPTRGKNISSIKPGENVQVLMDSSSPLAMKIIKGLNLIAGDKVKPIGAMVHSIKYYPKSGYRLYVKIAEGVLGKAEEEQDVKIKMGDPVVEEEIRKSQASLIIGIVAGAVVLAILLLFALIK